MAYNGPIGYDGRPCMWNDAAIVKWGPVVMPRQQDINTLGLDLTQALLDDSGWGDKFLSAQNFIATMDNSQSLFETMVSDPNDTFGPSMLNGRIYVA